MREIKFRAWHKKRKKFYEVLHLHIKSLMNGGIWATCRGKDCIEQQDVNIQVQPDDCIIEQFTGLLDKNGVEIYEGDIVHFFYNGNRTERVSYTGGSFNLGCCMSLFDTGTDRGKTDLEVIGNIHQNPELLEV